jgi:lipoate-protein ligase A
MRIVLNENIDPAANLALEEYLLKAWDCPVFMLWRNAPAIIIGRNQNALEEINVDYVKAKGIAVIRRLTGGGAVFHDLGNINFTFIMNAGEAISSYEQFTRPIVELLNRMGVPAEFSGRNDLLIDGKKFSGNAQTVYKNRILHHGTLLFSSDMTDLSAALRVNPLKIQSKGIKSIKSRVTNISEYLKEPPTVSEFMKKIEEYIFETNRNAENYDLNAADREAVNKLVNDKYGRWEWNFGESPQYNFKKAEKFDGGIVEVLMDVKNGYMGNIRIHGDFFGAEDISPLTAALNGVIHREKDVEAVVSTLDISKYMTNISPEELIKVMF